MRVCLTLMVLVLSAILGSRLAHASEPPAHFVVLVDDSGDMKAYRERIRTFLPQMLFTALPDRPAARPGIDVVSLGFYGIVAHERSRQTVATADPCRPVAGNSLAPENIIDWVDGVEAIRDSAGFQIALDEALEESCRWKHNWSPIAIAETLALPSVNRRLPADRTVSRVYVVNATNNAFNVSGQEIDAFSQRLGVLDKSQGKEAWTQVLQLFQRQARKGWDVFISPYDKDPFRPDRPTAKREGDLVLGMIEMKPAVGDLAAKVVSGSEVRVARHATARDAITLSAENDGTLRILEDERIKAQALLWSPAGKDKTWKVGGRQLPLSGSFPLAACPSPCTEATNGGRELPLLPALGIPSTVLPGQSPDTPVGVDLTIVFDLNAPDIYDHLRIAPPARRITLSPVPHQELPASNSVGALLAPALFGRMVIDDEALASWWKTADREPGLSQEGAGNRLLAARDNRQFMAQVILVGLALLALAMVLWLLYLFHYHRPFKPRLVWRPVNGLKVDFNGERSTANLAGSIAVDNTGRVPLFGRLLRNSAHPHCQATFTLNIAPPALILAKPPPLVGFSLAEAGRHAIQTQAEMTVTHETGCSLFLDPAVITDLHDTAPEVTSVVLTGTVTMYWTAGPKGCASGTAKTPVTIALTLIPEEAAPPRVTFKPVEGAVEFATDTDGSPLARQVGVFHFESTSRHAWAKPYHGLYQGTGYHRGIPLPESAFQLSADRIVVPPKDHLQVRLDLLCDGRVVTNPEQPTDHYAFRLQGEAAPGSEMDRHEFSLHRNATRPDLDLRLPDGSDRWHIHFNKDGAPCRVEEKQIGQGASTLLDGGTMRLAPRHLRFSADSPPSELLSLEFRNVARNDQGYLQVEIASRLRLSDNAQAAIELEPGSTLDDLIRCNDAPAFNVAADCSVLVRHIGIDTSRIRRIHGAVIPSGAIGLVVDVRAQAADNGHHAVGPCRFVCVEIPLDVEQLPAPNWLCIDFGTSAITAALGEGATATVLDLQHAHETLKHDGVDIRIDLASEDSRNSEHGTRFLPSFVMCDADLRQTLSPTETSTRRKGFPRYPQPSLRPGEPDFLSLPATADNIRNTPERVIYSLKSWVGVGADDILLGEEIRIESEDEETYQRTSRLPVRSTVESAFAALYEAYLQPLRILAGRVVITHPNTFTPHHVERLRDVVFRALGGRLGIPLRERIRMVSESDAAAFHHYIAHRDSLTPSHGTETVLVYDFGAGTLDLSLVRVTWASDGAPSEWTVLHRLGVPVAGNYLDSTLARLVHHVLSDPEVAPPEHFEYQHPIVTTSWSANPRHHRAAIVNLWNAIREAKQANGGWKGDTPMVLPLSRSLGHLGMGASGAHSVVRVLQQATSALDTYDAAPDDKPCLVYKDSDLRLSLPAELVRTFPPMVDFLKFVTATVVDECLEAAGVTADQVDTVLVSGRGALWPGLREAVWERFPARTQKTNLSNAQSMKEAVVRGAIAWQALEGQLTFTPPREARLAAQFENGTLVHQEEWGKGPLRFGSSTYFKLVQVAHRHPQASDRNTLRRHFYVDLNTQRHRRETYFQDGKVWLERIDTVSGPEILISNSEQRVVTRINHATSAGHESVFAPWPIGTTWLSPEEV